MKFMQKISMTILLGAMTMSLYGCSSEGNQYSPDQVIQNALEESAPAYYGEVEITVNDKGEKSGEIMKEWRSSDGKTRIESLDLEGRNKVISVNNGSVMTLYHVDQNEAYVIDDVETLEINPSSSKEQANRLLEMIQDTHEISSEGEANIAGRNAHHLLAKTNKKGALFGDLELWIDKEHWLILKMNLQMGDAKTEMAYTTIDFTKKISPDLFMVDLPANVDMKKLAEMSNTKEISLEEVPAKVGESVLYFPETEVLKISLVELYELHGELDRNEVSIDYTQGDLPLLTLSFFESEEMLGDATGESINIRNQEGDYIELGGVRSVTWQEDGTTYSILIIDPNVTVEEVIQMTEEMEVISSRR